MKRLSRAFIAVLLAVLTATLFPAQVFADAPDYVSEVKIFEGSYDEAAEEGFTLLYETDANGSVKKDQKGNPIAVDLNAGSGSTDIGAKGNKAVYLGYKTTKDKNKAITDLALMNMKGGYSVQEYEALMEMQMKQQIIPFAESFLTTIDEYRVNYKSKIKANKERAVYMHDLLNKMIDDDTGMGLGDLLLNKTQYEMTETAYNALSDTEKKKHADILTIIAQSNGQATLVMEKLLTRAADPYEDSWLERFEGTTPEDLEELFNGTPSEIRKAMDREYSDDANIILEQWDAFREKLLQYEDAVAFIENYEEMNADTLREKLDGVNEEASAEDFLEAWETLNDAEVKAFELNVYSNIVALHDYLDSIDYGDGTMLDYFTQETEDLKDDISILYPIVASLSDGQRAGLRFLSLEEMVLISIPEAAAYRVEQLENAEPISVYQGVDRAIYEKGGVALTSDALRTQAAAAQAGYDEYSFPTWLYVMMGLSAASTVGFIASVAAKIVINKGLWKIQRELTKVNRYITKFDDTFFDDTMRYTNFAGTEFIGKEEIIEYSRDLQKNIGFGEELLATKNSVCNKLMVGLGVAAIILSAVTVYLSYTQMKNYYKVDFTPIPHYMVDEKDITAYNAKGEKIVLKNQTAYYKAVESSRKKGDSYFDDIGTCADMNGCVNPQWLALYAARNEAQAPILANSLRAVVDSPNVPAGYQTGIHMFGEDAAFNLNSKLYCWNQSAKSVMVYFKTDDSAAVSTVGTSFSGGTLAVSTGGGFLAGAAVTMLGMTAAKKRKKNAAQSA